MEKKEEKKSTNVMLLGVELKRYFLAFIGYQVLAFTGSTSSFADFFFMSIIQRIEIFKTGGFSRVIGFVVFQEEWFLGFVRTIGCLRFL